MNQYWFIKYKNAPYKCKMLITEIYGNSLNYLLNFWNATWSKNSLLRWLNKKLKKQTRGIKLGLAEYNRR